MTESTALMERSATNPTAILEQVLITGDLSRLSDEERVTYYLRVCESVGLNPLTKPFEYIVLNNKLTLYALKACTDQLRSIRRVSVTYPAREIIGDVYVVTARATTPDGRVDESTGAVATGSLRGEALANAYMKAETKAKRRVTLSICGLGMLDETEVQDIPVSARQEAQPTRSSLVDLTADKRHSRPQPSATDAGEEHERLLDQTTEALKKLSGLRRCSGKKLMTEAAAVVPNLPRDFNAFNNPQLQALLDWSNAEIAKDESPAEVIDAAPEPEEITF